MRPMKNSPLTPGIVPGRPHEAAVAADRCYFCYDAPCVTACPTGIDIPLFIRQIATGTAEAAAQTILSANILGGMCARVCPTETCAKGLRARNRRGQAGRDRPAAALCHRPRWPAAALCPRAATGKRVAVVGAGPCGAGLRAPAGHAWP
jgi:dihydropyrimidine dehydrogenase (NAD+) subunit PreT